MAVLDLTSGVQRDVTTEGNWEPPESAQQYGEGCVWSPDGAMLAYQWIMHDAHEIRVVSRDGTGQRTLLRKEYPRYLAPLTWSADGRHVLVNHQFYDGSQRLLLVGAADGREKIIQTFAERHTLDARLSPSGRYVVYARRPASEVPRDIYLLDTESDEVARLVEHPADDALPEWTPDGRWIVFISDRRGSRGLWALRWSENRPHGRPHLVHDLTGEISPLGIGRDGSYYFGKHGFDRDLYTAEIDLHTGAVTKEVTRLVTKFEGVNSIGAYSPDGKRLAWLSKTSSTRETALLSIRDLATAETREISVRHPRLRWLYFGLSWLPDGRSLMICGPKTRHTTGFGYFGVDAVSGEVTEYLPEVFAAFSHPFAFSKDSRHLYFVEYKGLAEHNEGRVMRLDLDTGQQAPLQSPPDGDGIRNLAVSPDAAQLAFSTRRTLWVMPATGGPGRVIYQSSDAQKLASFSLAWAPDGDSLLGGMAREGVEAVALWQFFTDDREPRPVGITSPAIAGLDIHPNGRQILFGGRGNRSGTTLWSLDNLLTNLSQNE